MKALLLCVRALAGKEGASAMGEALGLGKALGDETRPVSFEFWIRGLHEFERLVGADGFAVLHRYVIHPKNLGVWSPLLRRAEGPEDVYQGLDTLRSDADDIGVWRTEVIGRCQVEATITLPHARGDERRLTLRALICELEAIPCLFGIRPARVTMREMTDSSISFSLTWAPMSYRPAAWGISSGLGAGAISGVGAGLAGAQAGLMSTVVVSATVIGGGLAWAIVRDAHYRATTIKQRTRILALERQSSLRQGAHSEISRPQDETLLGGHYRLGAQLGVGGSGSVWEATRVKDGLPVAIKILRTAVAGHGPAADRLRREAEALGLAWHPNVVQVRDHGVLASGIGFLVTERLVGETLASRVRRLGKLPPEEVVRFGLEAANALRAVDSAGLVHRDVKPANLFIHQEGPREVLKLFDFGIAYVRWAETRLTRDGIPLGTRGYAAPEQEAGDEVDGRADIYGLGVTLRELLTGQPPATRGSSDRLTASQKQSSTRSRDEVQRGENSGPLERLIDRMTAVNPSERPKDASEVKNALERISADSGHPSSDRVA